ncbi:hypothetical protein IAQ61_005922 [Plenodomus lingam]|uniref:uncharacterized protein n=1 Tax=Leptosphaeria maculans TaxID=5022 RepID=UPI00332C42FD|nr:hypothetical protein IAQ61_005922 [Plenodomus lingam]
MTMRGANQTYPGLPTNLIHIQQQQPATTVKMITDNQLYSLAIFLGSAAMFLIVLYHFLEVNSEDHKAEEQPKVAARKLLLALQTDECMH